MTIDFKIKKLVVDFKINKTLHRTDIIESFNVSNGSIYNWVNEYNNNKLNNTINRKIKITPSIKCYICKYVLARPNFNYKNLIICIKRNYDTTISKSSIYNILKKFKITKKKIYKTQILTNRKKRKELIKKFKNELKNKPFEDIMSLDECSIDTYIHNNNGWRLKGTKLRIINKHKRIRYTITCIIDYNGRVHIKIINNSSNALIFLKFIKEIIEKLPLNKLTYIVLDNARIHHAKLVQEHMKTVNHVKFIYNVPYSPESNPIEKVFSEAKSNICKHNINNKNVITNITRAFKNIKRKNIKKYYEKSFNYY